MKKIVKFIVIIVLLVGSISSTPQLVLADGGETTDLTEIELPLKGNPKLDTALTRLVSDNFSGSSSLLVLENDIGPVDSSIRVIIEGVHGQVEEITTAVGDLGNVEASYGDLLQVVVPLSQLTTLADMPNVRFVRLPLKPLPAITSEGVAVINADDWLTASYNGTGVKIGILDVGFSGYATRQGEGELPAIVTTWWAPSIGGEGTNIHGTGCAEIVYDIAPAASYYFANFDTVVEYGNAVNWLIAQGVDVISCSVGWPTGGPGDGTGTICQIVDTAKAAGILWAQAIGNHAQKHWQDYFTNADADAYHDFAPGDEGNTISVNNGETITVALKWDDTWGASANDYDLLLSDNNSNFVAFSLNVQDGDDNPWEALSYTATYNGTYAIAIGKLSSPQVVNFHLYSYYHNLQYQTASSSLVVPADSFSTVAVGAVNYNTPTTLESFSSRGPTDDGRVKPDLVAPDSISTASYSPNPFSGTSASAPHTAGAAALVKERFPSYTPTQIQDFLEGRAVDLGSAGKDNLYGSGRLHLGDSTDNYTLTMAVSGSGNVTPAAGSHTYAEGATVNITATAATNWEFVEWTGDVADTNSSNTTVTMNTDKMVTANFNPITQEWRKETADSSPDAGWWNSLALDSSGNPHISYQKSGIYLMYAYWNGSSWQIQTVDSPGDVGKGISLALDSSNYPYISYYDEANEDLRYAYWDGSTWQKETVDSAGYVGNFTSLALDSSSRPHISYYDETNDDLKYAYWDGSTWQIETVDNAGEYTSLALDTLNNPHIGYFDLINNDLRYAYWDGSSWHKETVDSAGYVGYFPSLALDSSNKPHISYCDWGNHDLKYAYWDGSSWQIDTIDSTGMVGHYPSLALDSSGNPHIAYIHWSNRDVKYSHWNGSTWQIETVDSDGSFMYWVSLALDSAGNPHISYYDENSHTLKYAYSKDSNALTMGINGSGSTSPAVGNHGYEVGATVNITATPATNWEFVNWTGDVADANSATTNVTMNTNITVTANFNRVNSVLQMKAGGSNNVTPAVGNHAYPIGATVNITATNTTNWEFVDWTGDVADTNSANTTITLPWDKTVTANFNRVASTLAMAISGSGNTTPAVGSHTYGVGAKVNITATPASGWQFVNWTGGVSAVTDVNSANTTVTMNSDYSITANFSQISTPSANGGGGGGGGLTGITTVYELMTGDGKFAVDATANSADFKVVIDIPKGTVCKNRLGTKPTTIIIKPMAEPLPLPANSDAIGLNYEIGPNGLTFDPAVDLTIKYDESKVLNKGFTESSLVIAWYDRNSSQWVDLESTVNQEKNTVTAKVSHFTPFTILARTRPASFTVTDLSITPQLISVGEDVTISIVITNTGDLTGQYEAVLKINNVRQDAKEVTIDGSDNITVSFSITGEDSGTYGINIGGLEGTFRVLPNQASFQISSLRISPDEVDIGANVDISVTVTNTGASAGNYDVILKINGMVIATKEVLLAAGATEDVVFTTAFDTAGKKIIDINGLLASLVVKGEVPPPAQVPLPLQETEITPSEPTQTPPEEAVSTPESNWWLIGGIIAGCVVVVGRMFYLFVWRKTFWQQNRKRMMALLDRIKSFFKRANPEVKAEEAKPTAKGAKEEAPKA